MEKKPIKQTPEMMVRSLLRDPPNGTLGHVFIVEALRNYADTIAASPVPEGEDNGVISKKAWHDCATDISKRIFENNAI